ncbi:cysteine desulfurase family protein [Sneathiella chinensis]|uniref:Cysteine desulfurase n=1 Tax=Sneathiella chinensis TaxID=349750 RepID=A0ABQ5U5V3_9PROT|nr:cysteine desulfurase family protein [Sneathiella chinensis]GLQ07547.1 cysteine desulfurase [Sneathiella chinensis]
MTSSIYLDYNATAPVRPQVVDLVAEVMKEGGNPSSVHASGRKAKGRVEDARAEIAALAGCKPQEIIFTSGGTEANNLALNGMGERLLLVSAAEHDSVLAAGPEGWVVRLPVDEKGLLSLSALEAALEQGGGPCLVSVMLANNETGVIQPIFEIAELVHAKGGLLHTDAIQALGKIPVDFRALGADMMSLSAHKIGGPQGQGALIVREGLPLQSIQKGGGQELGRRGGTENVAGIAGFGLAARLAGEGLADYAALATLRDHMEDAIRALCPEARIYGQETARLPNTSALSMPGVGAELQVMNFDLSGIAVSAGSACSSGKVKASHVLTAMGASDKEASEAIRVSLGWMTTQSDMDKFVQVWDKLYRRKSPKFAA